MTSLTFLNERCHEILDCHLLLPSDLLLKLLMSAVPFACLLLAKHEAGLLFLASTSLVPIRLLTPYSICMPTCMGILIT